MIEQLNDALKRSGQTFEVLKTSKVLYGFSRPKIRSKLQKKSVASSSKFRPYAFLLSKKYPI